ncbi:SIS domain-containing protein [Shimia sediminis]|uniref:SIS domain-containing protein n=1 Tax=Shimia sediminis TaxID=2497945 RepID=UPI000F8F0F15|nr:SIS domain-containing protein [Shimia sediminis]
MSTMPTLMHQEVREIPSAVERLLTEGGDAIRAAAALARDTDPRYFISVARGSSDHAASFLKYASELLLRLPMASVGPSVSSVYGVTLEARGAVGISVSQSGQSPDIVAMTQALRDSGALTVAITNNAASRLGQTANVTLPIHAGPELSVAATKTFVTSLVAGLWFLAELCEDDDLLRAIRALPAFLERATHCDWSAVAAAIDGRSLFTIGRGPSWAISNEAALKFKETCLIHAESYSSAEVLHGPVSIVGRGFPVIVFSARDKAEQKVAETADALADKGANVFAVTDKTNRATTLPHVRTDHWLCDPIPAIVSFYAMVEEIARAQGINPDKPRHLNKVTETV